MKPKEKKQTNKYGTKRALKIVGLVMLVYLLLHIRLIKDPYGDTFVAFNMDSLFGLFSSSGEGVVLFPHTMETELGSITMNPFCWIDYGKGYLWSIENDRFKSDITFNKQILKEITDITFFKIHDPANLNLRESKSVFVNGYNDLCITFKRTGYPIDIGINTINLLQIWTTSFEESNEFNNILLTIVCEYNPEYNGVLQFQNNILVNYKQFTKLFIPNFYGLWQLSHTDGIFIIEGLTKEPLECTKIYFEPDWGAIKKVVTPEGEELEF